MKVYLKFTLFLLVFLSMVSCTKNDYKIDVKKIDLDSYLVNRYEVDLMNIPIDDFDEGLISLSEKYEVFLGDLKTDTTGIHLIYEFATDKNVEIIYDECMQVFKDFSQIEKDFEKAFKHIKYYYSDFTPPNIYTYISGFDLDLPVFYNGRDLFIAIDMYLGENENYYALGIPNYIIRRMNRDYIVRDCLEQIAKYYNFSNDAYTRLIDLMIYHGKNWEFIKRSLPDTHDTIITGFTYAQLKWCEKNEEDVWKYLISDNTLFTNDLRVMRKLIDDAPYTSFFTQDSPGSVCKWIGWQIVHSYTKNNSLDLKELMITVDSEAILNKSGYRPK